MEMIEPTMLLVLALVAFVAGFIDAVAGGGGMLTVPALLSLGLPPHLIKAQYQSLAQSCIKNSTCKVCRLVFTMD